MVYIERQAADIDGGLADLITFDLNSGVELSRDRIANFGDRIVAFDGPRVVITRQRANPELPPITVALHLREGAILSSQGTFLGSYRGVGMTIGMAGSVAAFLFMLGD